MTWDSQEFAETNQRGQFSLAFEGTCASRFISMCIAREQTNQKIPEQQRLGRVAVLIAARKLVEELTTKHIDAAWKIKGDINEQFGEAQRD